ncbi:autotransporter outer membrane beta-barrel domain-containing protein [Bartonella vinsonii]|uniref:autotransporter family protein n=1 Tax=Bartonella vinsonii TaxID=33047 RepID=UPI0002B6E270|nr:autotransporter outer membrane beta-barrel domain-containing protein [Bartonella vinsonii]AGF76277.1 autotransporter [Bartonella vinsonii subsp. berkhoffii str. Winnie]
MIKLFKNHLSLCAVTTAVLFFVPNVSAKVQGNTNGIKLQAHSVVNAQVGKNVKNQFQCDENASSYRCADGKLHYIGESVYQKSDKNADEIIAIEASQKNTRIKGTNITIKDVLDTGNSEKGFWQYGVRASDQGNVELREGVIDFTNGIAVQTKSEGLVYLQKFSITGKRNQVVDVDPHSRNSAFHMSQYGGFISVEDSKVDVSNTDAISLQGDSSNIDIFDSTVVVKGHTSYGMRFEGEKESEGKENISSSANMKEWSYVFWGEGELFGNQPKKGLPKRGGVYLYTTMFTVPNSTVIYSRESGAVIKVLENSTLSGNLLLKVEDGSFVKVAANASALVGGARMDESSHAEFRLRNGAKWTLTRPKNGNLQDKGTSSISLIHLSDSSIIFEQPKGNTVNDYQTLRIGKGSGVVYKAQGDAHLYLNTYLNEGGALQVQKTDRVLIYGDVEGKTTVHVQSVPRSPGGSTGEGGNNQGISLIQVSGKAEEDSFLLNNDYVALDGLPYQYRLYAYGPESTLGKANPTQRLVDGEGEFWDFRLENRYVDFVSKPIPEIRPFPYPESSVKAVVPQVPTYLLVPNSVFHAGLMDINNQNKQLEILRTTSSRKIDNRENPALYLRGYGGSYRYASDLSALEYGYKGDLNYNGVEAGILLHTIENADTVMSLGVMGTYGKLSLQPVDVEQSQKSAFDKWTATAYGSMQHDAGFYVDGLLSYGLFKGDVLTLARGKAATLKGSPLSASLIGGKAFATGYEGFVFDPQVQVVYQHLHFDKARDIDNFDIEMGKLDQWVARVGGCLTKMFSASEKEHDISMYAKLYFTHAFEEKQSVHFKDAFQLGAFGSSLEAGLGFNAKLSQKFALHADLSYQHQLNKVGFSGISFSGGLRYRF